MLAYACNMNTWERLTQGHHMFKASLGHIVKPYLKKHRVLGVAQQWGTCLVRTRKALLMFVSQPQDSGSREKKTPRLLAQGN